jgi:hypothetical protein
MPYKVVRSEPSLPGHLPQPLGREGTTLLAVAGDEPSIRRHVGHVRHLDLKILCEAPAATGAVVSHATASRTTFVRSVPSEPPSSHATRQFRQVLPIPSESLSPWFGRSDFPEMPPKQSHSHRAS